MKGREDIEKRILSIFHQLSFSEQNEFLTILVQKLPSLDLISLLNRMLGKNKE